MEQGAGFEFFPEAAGDDFGLAGPVGKGGNALGANGFGFADRLPYATPLEGLYSCSAGCHPAGSVIGAAGHNAANRVLKDLKA